MTTIGRKFYTPREQLNIWQWNAKHTDFSLCSSHETNIKTAYDPELMPMWKEPQESLTDPTVKEVIVLKPSRSMGTESVDMNAVRYYVGIDPLNILFVGADEKWAELFFKKRLLLGLKVNRITDAKLSAATIAGTRIAFDDCDITVDYPGSKSVAKGFGYALVIGSEVSMWKNFVADMLRKRLATHRFGHLLLESAPDPAQTRSSAEDPIFIEYKNGDMRHWFCRDPASGEPFEFKFKGENGDGLKWDKRAKREDGSWDFDMVAKTAHYVTPGGAIIEESERLNVIRKGWWMPTNPKAASGVRSYKIPGPAPVFYTAEFPHLAVKFLEAKRDGYHAIKTYFYEHWGDECEDKNPSYSVEWGAIWQFRDMLNYSRRSIPCDDWFKLFLNIDVQKFCVKWNIWAQAVSGMYLIDHGTALNFDDMTALLNQHLTKKDNTQCGVDGVVIDTGHKPDECYEWIRNIHSRAKVIPVKGNENALTGGEIYKWGLPLQNHPWIRILSIHSTHWHDLSFRTLAKIEPKEGQTFEQAASERQIRVYFHNEIDAAYAQELRNEWVEEQIVEGKEIKRIPKCRTPHDHFDLFRYALIARSIMQSDLQQHRDNVVKELKKEKEDDYRAVYYSDEYEVEEDD